MKRMQRILCCCLPLMGLVLTSLIAAPASAKVSAVVSSASTYKPSAADVKSYFLGVKLEWPDGAKVQILDQPDAAIAKTFYEKFLGSSVSVVRKEWTKLILSGAAAAPVKCASDAEVKKALAASPAAIGFIDSSALDGTVREVASVE